ncbi:hypothetical protein LTS08_007759 [Lithohypha guttulata]|nr:hypothetical protein LTS08_007759 [Lithohypha guttulata]
MKSITAFTALVAAVNAHMFLREPLAATPAPDSSPIASSGADYPCRGVSDVNAGPPNSPVPIGGTFQLKLRGSATHGGGSCQVSLAKGWKNINKDTKFKVIHSIQGGCPASDPLNDNISTDGVKGPKNLVGVHEYGVTVPDHPDLPPGEYTMAWTWHNRIGNREMYMNCAQFTIAAGGSAAGGSAAGGNATIVESSSGATGKRASQNPLPDLFKANIGNGCSVDHGGDVEYPWPGDSLEIGPKAKLIDPAGGAACGSTIPAASSPTKTPVVCSTGYDVLNDATVGGGSGTAATSAAGAAGAGVAAGSVAISAAIGLATQAASSASAVASAIPTVANGSVPIPGKAASGAGACTAGWWSCAEDSGSFQRCVHGAWSVDTPMAAGTKCVPGVSAELAYV